MKKILICLSLLLLLVTGCGNNMNTPTKKVEEFLGKYQSMDSDVLTQLDNIIASDETMSDDDKKEYRSLMEKQYQNLSYKIKDEEIDGDTATVLVEIEVLDYATSIGKSREYYNDHPEEFAEEDAEPTINEEDRRETDESKPGDTEAGDSLIEQSGEALDDIGDALEETAKYITYKIEQLKNVTDKVKYEITFHLTKVDGEWQVDDISDIDRQKLHGLYEG